HADLVLVVAPPTLVMGLSLQLSLVVELLQDSQAPLPVRNGPHKLMDLHFGESQVGMDRDDIRPGGQIVRLGGRCLLVLAPRLIELPPCGRILASLIMDPAPAVIARRPLGPDFGSEVGRAEVTE